MDAAVSLKEDPRPDDGEEFLELPPRTAFVRPGHLWKADDKTEEMEMLLHRISAACAEQSEMLNDFLRTSHQEVLDRLDTQDDILNELRRMSMQSPKEGRSSVNLGWYPSPIIGPGSAPNGSPKVVVGDGLSQPIFRTFEAADQLLKEGAAAVDADEAAKKMIRLQSTAEHVKLAQRSYVERVVFNPLFDIFFAWVVVTNSIFIGVEVQVALDTGASLDAGIEVIQYVYTALFSFELMLRIAAHGKVFFCNEDWMWNYLDIFVVLTSVWEKVADYILRLGEANGDLPHLSGLKALRLVRISRIVKVARLARVLRFVMALRTLISSIIYTLKSLVWAMILLWLIVYVFAVLFTQAVGDHLLVPDNPALTPSSCVSDVEETAKTRYFGSLQDAMLSLFMSIAGGVSWIEVVGELKVLSTGWVLVFLFYIAFTYFAVLNVVTGVFCQSAIDSAQNDQTLVLQSIQAEKQANIEKITNLFRAIDIEETGVITYKMLEDQVNSAEVQTYFESIGLDVWDAWSFFKLLDSDAGGAVELNEFLMGCLRLRGQARSMDVVRVMRDQAWLVSQQSRFWTYMEAELTELRERLPPRRHHRLSPSHIPSPEAKARAPQKAVAAAASESEEDLDTEKTRSLIEHDASGA